MLTGFNTNIRHKGVLFHVQTEDSGRAHPHVITHLYHGGTILASEKRAYGELLQAADPDQEVRALMEELHKSMLRRLRAGEFDALIAQRLAGGAGASAAGADTAPTDRPQGSPQASADPATPLRPLRAFGEGVVSEKPLDEVVLEYLVESARRRKRSAP